MKKPLVFQGIPGLERKMPQFKDFQVSRCRTKYLTNESGPQSMLVAGVCDAIMQMFHCSEIRQEVWIWIKYLEKDVEKENTYIYANSCF